jgi:predicted amidophosphoribosyltransferase
MLARECVDREEFDTGSQFLAWRWYFITSALPWASQNGQWFHHWILKLKPGNDHEPSKQLFARVLRHLWNDPLETPDAIVVMPPSKCFDIVPDYPLISVADLAESLGCGIHLKHLVKRIKTIDRAVDNPAMRDIAVQQASMRVTESIPERVRSVLLVDDVWTSGATIRAARSLILDSYPGMKVSALAFGRRQATGSTPFPEDPVFPNPWETTVEDLGHFL